MENFVERVSRRKLKSLLHGKAWPQYNYNQHANSPRGENFYAGSKRKPENSSNTRGHSQILSKPRSSRNFNFNNIRGRRLRGRLYNTATGEVEEESPFILPRRARIPHFLMEPIIIPSPTEVEENPPDTFLRRFGPAPLLWLLNLLYLLFGRLAEYITDELEEMVGSP